MAAGVNYPWRHYGGDFGPTVWGTDRGIRHAAAPIAADLAAMRAAGIAVVRWFLFTDARGGLVVGPDGRPAAIHDDALADLDTLLAMALEAGVTLVPVLAVRWLVEPLFRKLDQRRYRRLVLVLLTFAGVVAIVNALR